MNERLVEFLYILSRDHLPHGVIEGIMWDHVSGGEPDSYCNTYLEGWARDMTRRLINDDAPIVDYKHMFKGPNIGVSPPQRWFIRADGIKEYEPYGNSVDKK